MVAVALAYDRPEPPIGLAARISRYAQGRSYHNVLRKRLRRVRRILEREGATEVEISVDAGSYLERTSAAAAGLGWLGKNSMLIHPHLGSYLFLGVALTDLAIRPDLPMVNHCGSCERCLTACPTGAIVAPGTIDSRRCISYLNIEQPPGVADPPGVMRHGWLHGCDDCQEACPFVTAARRKGRIGDAAFRPDPRWGEWTLADLAAIGDDAWDNLTLGSDLRRGGPKRLRDAAQRAGGRPPRAKENET
jgi:epoxyqueuosine reductase